VAGELLERAVTTRAHTRRRTLLDPVALVTGSRGSGALRDELPFGVLAKVTLGIAAVLRPFQLAAQLLSLALPGRNMRMPERTIDRGNGLPVAVLAPLNM
jgi:hypothetical protein